MAEDILTESEILSRLGQAEPLRKFPTAYLKRQAVVPFCDRAASLLKIVMADARAIATAEDVRQASGMKSFEILKAERATIESLIQKLQNADWTPAVDAGPAEPGGPQGVAPAAAAPRREAEVSPQPDARAGAAHPGEKIAPPGPFKPPGMAGPADEAPAGAAARPSRTGIRVVLAEPDGNLRFAAGHILEREGYTVVAVADLEELASAIRHEPPELAVVKAKLVEDDLDLEARIRRIAPRTEVRIVPDFGKLLQGEPVPYSRLSRFLFDLVDLFLSIIETGSGRPKGQAHARALYAKLVAQKLGLTRKNIDETTLAAYLADFGESLVSFRFGESGEGASGSPSPSTREPLALLLEILKGIHPPYDVASILATRSESRTGKGEETPIGARILTVVDLFIRDKWAGTPFDRIQKGLREEAGSRLDPRVVEALLGIVRDEMFLDRLGQVRQTVLIADPDGQTAALIELRLANEGYDVHVARTGPEALRRARSQPPDLILSEVLLPGLDGYGLLETLKGDEGTAGIPFVFVSSQSDSQSITQGLDLGAEDYLTKPPDLNVLLAKAKRFLSRAAGRKGRRDAAPGGLSGSLDQISLVDMLQILSMGSKTVRLDATCENRAGCFYIREGTLTDVVCGPLRGTDAFYEMMTFTSGTFSVTPDALSETVTITESLDFLILEGMRRFDEALSRKGTGGS